MSTPPSFLAFDLGASSGRAMLGQLDGNNLSLAEVHRFPNTTVYLPGAQSAGTLHWDILRLWADIQAGLGQAVQQAGGSMVSVGIDTWGVDFGLLDQHGTLLGNPVHYRDSRTDGMMDAAFARVSRAAVFERTGIQFMQLNSLYQLLSLVHSQSPMLDVAQTFLTIPDLLNYWLTGCAVSEFSIATTTQCYDPRAADWATGMLEILGIPTHIFPEIVAAGTVLGEVRPVLARELDTSKLPVVAPACHDTGSAVAGVPASGADFAWISSGTWSIMGVEVTEPVINEQALAFNFTNEGGVGGTFRFCKNVMGLWLVQECQRTWADEGHDYSFTELVQLASQAEPLVSLVDPDADDFLKPGDMPARIREFCARTAQPVPESHGAIVRCALESLALKYRFVLESLETMTGQRLEPLHMVGGGTQNTLLNQFTADATGRAVITGPAEATAIGNLIVQAMAMGHLSSLQEGRAVVRNSFETVAYEPAGDSARWAEAYARQQALAEVNSA